MTLAVGTKVRCVKEPWDAEGENFLLGKTGTVLDSETFDHTQPSSKETLVKWDDFNEGWLDHGFETEGPFWIVDDTDLEVVNG